MGPACPARPRDTRPRIPAWLPFPGSGLSDWNYLVILGRGGQGRGGPWWAVWPTARGAGSHDPWVRRELQCQLSPVLTRRQYIQNKGSFARTGDGMLGAEAPGSHPVSPEPRGSAAAGHVGQMHGAHQLWAASRPSPFPGPALPWVPVLRPEGDTELLALCAPAAARFGSCRLTCVGKGRQGSAGRGLH